MLLSLAPRGGEELVGVGGRLAAGGDELPQARQAPLALVVEGPGREERYHAAAEDAAARLRGAGAWVGVWFGAGVDARVDARAVTRLEAETGGRLG